MFGNKGYRWKLGAALALIAALGVLSSRRGDAINPSLWRCLAEPRRWDGKEIWIPGARIVEVRERDYDLQAGSVRIRVAGPAPGTADSSIGMIAVFRSAGPLLEPVRTRPLPDGSVPRRVMEAVSILVTLAVLANFVRHFLFRPQNLQADGGDGLMADLLVHAATGFVAGRPLRDGRVRSILYVGVCLPDLLYKALLYLGGAPTWLCEPTHSPLGLIPFCYVGALLFEESWRKRAFWALLGGGWLHLLVDLGKNYMGSGVILWAFPFSMDAVELGWYYPEDSPLLMLPALALMAVVELAGRLSARRPASP